MIGIKKYLILTGCLSLLSCAMQPQAVREQLDQCSQLGLDALVYNREGDGAVMKVLCIPNGDEVKHSATYPLKWSRIVNKLLKNYKYYSPGQSNNLSTHSKPSDPKANP